jgi:hypothetical protein
MLAPTTESTESTFYQWLADADVQQEWVLVVADTTKILVENSVKCSECEECAETEVSDVDLATFHAALVYSCR